MEAQMDKNLFEFGV